MEPKRKDGRRHPLRGAARIGLFAGGMETYWKDTGMAGLDALLERDAQRLADSLGTETVFDGIAGSVEESADRGRALREADCDLIVIYHASYVEDEMTLAFLDAVGSEPFLLLLHSQGVQGIPEDFSLLDYGRCYGNNSAVQVAFTTRRLVEDRTVPYLVGDLDAPQTRREILGWARAAMAVRSLKGANIAMLPHWCTDASMYDTFPDPATMMMQTGVRITFRYASELAERVNAASGPAVDELVEEIYSRYEVLEPPREEVTRAAAVALGIETLCADFNIDCLAVDPLPHVTKSIGMLPAFGLDRQSDLGTVISIEADLTVAVGGLILRGLTGKPMQHFEHLMFDLQKNWLLGGHDGGSTAFSMAHPEQPIKIRNTMYVDYKQIPFGFDAGVVPEFITRPGPVTMLNLCPIRENGGRYAMRLITGESVDTKARPIHMEHTILKPDIPVADYFPRLAHYGVDHHFALVHGELEDDLHKVATFLKMDAVDICTRSSAS